MVTANCANLPWHAFNWSYNAPTPNSLLGIWTTILTWITLIGLIAICTNYQIYWNLSFLTMSLAMLLRYLHFFNFSGVVISAESKDIPSLEYGFDSFIHWILLSLDNDCFETISPISDDITFLLPFSVLMLTVRHQIIRV